VLKRSMSDQVLAPLALPHAVTDAARLDMAVWAKLMLRSSSAQLDLWTEMLVMGSGP
jgi:hypothetical protein